MTTESGAVKDASIKNQISYRVGQDNVRFLSLDVHNPVFFVSAFITIIFVILVIVFREFATAFFDSLRLWVIGNLDWFFVSSMNYFLLFCLVVAVGKTGRIRIGGDSARPEYSNLAWVAMLFSAGMASGLLYWGVLEPVTHSLNPPLGIPAEPHHHAQRVGLAGTIFHWGLHAWSVYAMIGLALAYFSYSRGLPMTLRSVFYPLLGKRVWGPFGHVIDTLAVFATLFGLATSLAYGSDLLTIGLADTFTVNA